MESILKSHSVATLKKEISKSNVKGYSKMKKAEIIELMLEHKEKFGHIKMADKKERSEKQKANDKKLGEMAKKKEKKEAVHTMDDGAVHTGETHTKDSKVVKESPKKKLKFKVKTKPLTV
tara:strand:- start:381 stop:740 length:360 start_codon:yes stop_codon:yes gene_type:complete